MGKARKALSKLVGGIQCGLGGIVAVLALLVYASLAVREALAIASEEVYLYIFAFMVFSAISIASGSILIWEGNEES